MDSALAAVAALFIAVLVTAAWLYFPGRRAASPQQTANAPHPAPRYRFHRPPRKARQRPLDGGAQTRTGSTILAHLNRHRITLILLLLCAALPSALIFSLHRHPILEGYQTITQDDDRAPSQIALLIKGEQLVPPSPLPPEIFVTKEVEIIRPDLDSASRDWDKLHSDFRQRLLVVFKTLKERYGYDVVLIEGYRSPERQTLLASKGRNVTNARADQSYHQYGLAADCAFLRDGKLVITEKDPWAFEGYQHYGQVAAEAGLVWGGKWTFQDLGHVELHAPGIGPHSR